MEVSNNTFVNHELNVGQLNSMINEIETMSSEQHEQILNIINDNNNDLNYTENDNGIFIKLNTLTIDVILKIYKYVESTRNDTNDIQTAVQTFESYEHLNRNCLNTNINTNTNITSNDSNEHSDIDVEDWKIAIIEKMRNSSKTKTKTKNKKSNK